METKQGAFYDSLIRNNKQIKSDRAEAILEDAELYYSRKIQDLQTVKKKLVRDRKSLLDLSPTNAQSLVLASDFDAQAFITRDLEIGLKIREIDIQLEILEAQYSYYFASPELQGGE